jgi:hypothetical protein
MSTSTLNRYMFRRVIAGVDWGFTNPGVIVVGALDSDDRLYIVHQVYQTQQLIGWWVNVAQSLRARYNIEKFVCDPSEPGHIAEFESAGLNVEKANNDVRLGIQAVADRLRPVGDGRPRLFVLRDSLAGRDEGRTEKNLPCGIEEEMMSYIWDTRNNQKRGEEPLKENDHSMDALRYLIAEIDQIGQADDVVRVNSYLGQREVA